MSATNWPEILANCSTVEIFTSFYEASDSRMKRRIIAQSSRFNNQVLNFILKEFLFAPYLVFFFDVSNYFYVNRQIDGSKHFRIRERCIQYISALNLKDKVKIVGKSVELDELLLFSYSNNEKFIDLIFKYSIECPVRNILRDNNFMDHDDANFLVHEMPIDAIRRYLSETSSYDNEDEHEIAESIIKYLLGQREVECGAREEALAALIEFGERYSALPAEFRQIISYTNLRKFVKFNYTNIDFMRHAIELHPSLMCFVPRQAQAELVNVHGFDQGFCKL